MIHKENKLSEHGWSYFLVTKQEPEEWVNIFGGFLFIFTSYTVNLNVF